MANDLELLKKEIQYKNILLSKLDASKNSDKSKIQLLKIELDKLLYVYYKNLTRVSIGMAF